MFSYSGKRHHLLTDIRMPLLSQVIPCCKCAAYTFYCTHVLNALGVAAQLNNLYSNYNTSINNNTVAFILIIAIVSTAIIFITICCSSSWQ
jgi:hypothetical protein